MNLSRRSFLKGLFAAATVAATTKIGADAVAAAIEDAGPSLCEKTTAALKAAFPDIKAFHCGRGRVDWSDGSYTLNLWSEGHGETDDDKIASMVDLLTRHQDQLVAAPRVADRSYRTKKVQYA